MTKYKETIDGTLEDAKRRLLDIRELGECAKSKVDFFEEPVPFRVRMMCDKCTIVNDCLDYALLYERYGFWGGTTERERIQIRKIRRVKLTDAFTRQPHTSATNNPAIRTFECGKPGAGGYRAHKRRGEQACEACLVQFRLVSEKNNKKRKVVRERFDMNTGILITEGEV